MLRSTNRRKGAKANGEEGAQYTPLIVFALRRDLWRSKLSGMLKLFGLPNPLSQLIIIISALI